MQDVLPDSLKHGLEVVFVGTAAGHRSAAEGAYYAHPGNRFWRALAETGLTPRKFEPGEFRDLLALGIGFTDLCKTQSGGDHLISDYDVGALTRKIRRHHPRAVAFTSKKGGSLFLGRSTGGVVCGRQPDVPDFPALFVLPSPSGAASGHWDIGPWKALAKWLRATRD